MGYILDFPTITMPKSEAAAALRDLARMGIDERSMFPGLDGACRRLTQVHFRDGWSTGLPSLGPYEPPAGPEPKLYPED